MRELNRTVRNRTPHGRGVSLQSGLPSQFSHRATEIGDTLPECADG